MTTSIRPTIQKSSAWIFSPVLDLLFACGGLFWLLVLMHLCLTFVYGRKIVDLPFELGLVLLGNIFLSNTHIAATLIRLYGDKPARGKLWVHSYVSVLICAGLLLACASNQLVFVPVILLYLAFQIDHVVSQNYGVCMMYCQRAGVKFTGVEKFLFKFVHHALAWYAILRTLTYDAFIPKYGFGFGLPVLGPVPEIFAVLAAICLYVPLAIFLIKMCVNAKMSKATMPLPAQFLFLTNLVMFTAPIGFTQIFYLFGSTFFHALQYILVSTFYNLQDARSGEVSVAGIFRQRAANRNYKYWLALLGIGSIFILFLPLAISKMFSLTFASSSVMVLVCVSLHHFMTDRELWKFRDAKVRRLLVGEVEAS